MEKNIKRRELNPDNICDLDPRKLCDSCGKCLNMDNRDYFGIEIEDIDLSEEDYNTDKEIAPEEIEKWEKLLNESNADEIQLEYIEDIPELKEEYDKKIAEILKELAKDK